MCLAQEYFFLIFDNLKITDFIGLYDEKKNEYCVKAETETKTNIIYGGFPKFKFRILQKQFDELELICNLSMHLNTNMYL